MLGLGRDESILRSKVATIGLGLSLAFAAGAGGAIVASVENGRTLAAFDLDLRTPDRADDVSVVPSPSGLDTSGTAAASDQTLSLHGLRVYANRGAGYVFIHPAEWNVTTHGEDSELRSPGGEVVFSFGQAPAGPLPDAATAVADRYFSDPEEMRIVSSHEETTEQGLRAWVVGGIGQGPAGRDDRFLAISVDAPSGNRAIMVRFPSGPDVLDVLPEIRSVISSYRVAGEGK